jgi:hypothetical protein
MASRALGKWESTRASRLDELETVHVGLTGTAPGRRRLTEQLDRAYVLTLASQFQGFTRDLHSELASHFAGTASPAVRPVFDASLTLNRHLDRGNPNAGNLGNDFARFGLDFWPTVYAADARNIVRRERLDQIMIWRNSIAHESDIAPGDRPRIAGTKPTLTWGRLWRRALDALARSIDRAVANEVAVLLGRAPW